VTAGTAGLRRYLQARAPAGPVPEHCDLCATAVPDDHQHLLDLGARTLRCACRPCALLFADRAREAAGTMLRTVPDRYRYDPGFTLTDDQWDALQVPVGLAFFRREAAGAMVAAYPGPAGATESELDVGTAIDASRLAATLEPDVEALLVRHDDVRHECLLVPIDACFRLVGIVRRHWKGFDGGAEAWSQIDAFFADVRSRAREVAP
jgi:hypothetical protein